MSERQNNRLRFQFFPSSPILYFFVSSLPFCSEFCSVMPTTPDSSTTPRPSPSVVRSSSVSRPSTIHPFLPMRSLPRPRTLFSTTHTSTKIRDPAHPPPRAQVLLSTSPFSILLLSLRLPCGKASSASSSLPSGVVLPYPLTQFPPPPRAPTQAPALRPAQDQTPTSLDQLTPMFLTWTTSLRNRDRSLDRTSSRLSFQRSLRLNVISYR